jgi:general secretion pathway protein F
MPTFDYIAYDHSGSATKGSVVADSGQAARKKLKSQGLLVSEISDVAESIAGNGSTGLSWRRGISPAELALVLQQLGVLIQSGLPLEESLQLLTDQAEGGKARRMIASWHRQILEGQSLSQAMNRGDINIPEHVMAAVHVGEETGHLDSILIRSAEELELSTENRQAFKRGIAYPLTLLVFSAVVVAVMMIFVVPKITKVFVHSQRELPFITQAVISTSEFFALFGPWLLLAFLAMAAISWQQLRDENNRRLFHRWLLKLPVMGRWIMIANLADWSRSLGTLLGSGVPALAALRIAASTMTNLHLRSQMLAVNEQVRQGSRIHSALVKQGVGIGFLQHMVGSGEASSELDTMLTKVAEYYTHRLKNSTESFLKFLGPILIVLLGCIVMTIVAAVMLPILDMNKMI